MSPSLPPFNAEFVASLRVRLDGHPIYGAVKTLADLRVFMAHHVHSVWDFMSLIKYLQHAVARQAAIRAVEARMEFWDGVLAALPSKNKQEATCLN